VNASETYQREEDNLFQQGVPYEEHGYQGHLRIWSSKGTWPKAPFQMGPYMVRVVNKVCSVCPGAGVGIINFDELKKVEPILQASSCL